MNCRHGLGRMEYFILNDPSLSFKDILQRHLCGEPLVEKKPEKAERKPEKAEPKVDDEDAELKPRKGDSSKKDKKKAKPEAEADNNDKDKDKDKDNGEAKEKEVKKLVPSKLNIESIMQEETTIKAQQYVPPALPAVDMTSIAASIR